MAYVDMTLPEFQKRFFSDEACLQAVFDARWPHGFVCPKCQHNDGYRLQSRPRIVQCTVCHKQSSITSKTLFHRSHISLPIWFLAIYLMAHDKRGISATRLQNQLGVSYPTAWFLIQRLHLAMSKRDENLTLAGYIELDEAFFGGRHKQGGPGGKSPSYNKQQVLVLVESEGAQAGNLVMQLISGAEMKDLKPVIAAKIESEPPGQWFRSDAWGSHSIVTSLGHRIQMQHVPNEEQDKVLKCVNLAVSNAKSYFKGTYHHFCKIHMQRYLDAFCYRWNRRHLVGQLAGHLISACSLAEHTPYLTVIAARPAKAES